MIFFFSGYDAIKAGPVKDWVIQQCPSRLQSCHDVHMKSTTEWLERSIELGVAPHVDLMLDSGAFTAWNAGHHTTLDELMPVYTEIQEKYARHFKSAVYINLDVIPGSREKAPTPQEIEQALIDSDVNFEMLEKEMGKGIILPVFHQGEDWERLFVIAKQSNYICVAPRQTLSEDVRIRWVQQINTKLKGMDNVLHGLATTGNTIIKATNWFSVDSATWVLAAAFGSIFLEIGGRLRPLAVSQESPGRKKRNAHFETLSDNEREYINSIFDTYGFTFEMLTESNAHRRAFNLISVREWSNKITPSNHAMEQGLFDEY